MRSFRIVRSTTRSDGGRTYTFELKRTFRFDTGERVTAQSFADAFNRNANKKLGSPAARHMQEIIRADAAMRGTAKTVSGVEPLGDYRLRIRLMRPAGDLVARLDAVLLPDLARDAVDRPINVRMGRGRTTSLSASSAGASSSNGILLPRWALPA